MHSRDAADVEHRVGLVYVQKNVLACVAILSITASYGNAKEKN